LKIRVPDPTIAFTAPPGFPLSSFLPTVMTVLG